MKVLAVVDTLAYGGAEKLLASLAEANDPELELSVVTLVPETDPRMQMLPVLRAAGLEVRFAGISRMLQPSAVPRLARMIRDSGCDVVHAHLGYSAVLAPLAARVAGVPSVATLHHVPQDMSFRETLKERLWVNIPGRLGRLVFVSEAARTAFAERFKPRRSWRVVHNGVDVSRFDDVVPAALGVPPGAPVVTVVAALREPKGHDVALRAWPRVLDAVPEAHLVVVGDGDHRPHLESATRTLGLAERVVFTGTRDDVPAVLAASTLAALPSFTEALPTALVEAGAAGLACVATDVGGIPEVVAQGVTGLLVPAGDADAFADAVVRLLGDRQLREQYGAAARRRAREHFSIEAWIERLLALYREAGARG